MAGSGVDREIRRRILDARRMIQQAEKTDCNEAETRRRIERVLESLMGYDALKHLSRERAVRGAGETEHVDFTIQVDEGDEAKPMIMLEVKRVNVDLARKHLRQVSSYAIDAGCEWILLTNSKEWQLHHVSFGQPPVTKLVRSWNILTDDISALAAQFDLISHRNLKKNTLDELWQKTNVLRPRNLLQAMLSENSIKLLRRELRKDSGILLSPEDIVSAIRRMLNEAALGALEDVRVSLPGRKSRKRKRRAKQAPAGTGAAKAAAGESPEKAGQSDESRRDTD